METQHCTRVESFNFKKDKNKLIQFLKQKQNKEKEIADLENHLIERCEICEIELARILSWYLDNPETKDKEVRNAVNDLCIHVSEELEAAWNSILRIRLEKQGWNFESSVNSVMNKIKKDWEQTNKSKNQTDSEVVQTETESESMDTNTVLISEIVRVFEKENVFKVAHYLKKIEKRFFTELIYSGELISALCKSIEAIPRLQKLATEEKEIKKILEKNDLGLKISKMILLKAKEGEQVDLDVQKAAVELLRGLPIHKGNKEIFEDLIESILMDKETIALEISKLIGEIGEHRRNELEKIK